MTRAPDTNSDPSPHDRSGTHPPSDGTPASQLDEPQGGRWAVLVLSGLAIGIGGNVLPAPWSRWVVLTGCALAVAGVVLLLLGARRS